MCTPAMIQKRLVSFCSHFMSSSSHNISPLADIRQRDAEIVCLRLVLTSFCTSSSSHCGLQDCLYFKALLFFSLNVCLDKGQVMEKIFFFNKLMLHQENLLWSVVHAESHSYLLTSIYCTYTQSLSDYLTKYIFKST